jgi:hypothetical protein
VRLLIVAVLAACHHGSAPPPPPPGCVEVAEHVRALLGRDDEGARDIQRVFQTRCTDDRWPADMRSCVTSTQSFKDPKHCKARLTIAQRSHLDADLQDAAAARRTRQYPPPCVLYEQLVTKMMMCDKLPATTRDAMRQGLDSLKQNWTGLDDPRRYNDVSVACKAAAEAMRQAGTSVGCLL